MISLLFKTFISEWIRYKAAEILVNLWKAYSRWIWIRRLWFTMIYFLGSGLVLCWLSGNLKITRFQKIVKFFLKSSFAHFWQIHSYICTLQTRPSLPNNFFHQLSPPPGLEPTTPGLPAQCLYRYATAAFLGIMVTKVFLILNLNNLMFKEIVLKNRKTSLVLESTISKVSKVNLNHFSTNWIRKCGISFKRIALILERKTNFFDSVEWW